MQFSSLKWDTVWKSKDKKPYEIAPSGPQVCDIGNLAPSYDVTHKVLSYNSFTVSLEKKCIHQALDPGELQKSEHCTTE